MRRCSQQALIRACQYARLQSVGEAVSRLPRGGPALEHRARNSLQAYGTRGFCAGGSAPSSSRSNSEGPVSWASLSLALVTGSGLIYLFNREKERKQLAAASRSSDRSLGNAAIGGPFRLVDSATGRPVTERDLLGGFHLLYFGFTHCPDVCPEELVKMAEAVDLVEKQTGTLVTPVFISIDPERDGVKQVRSYVKEFHPRLLGFTGSLEACSAAAKAFRVYYHKTAEEDYLVDHSIITYLLHPGGRFLQYFGKNVTAAELAEGMAAHVRAWKGQPAAPAVAAAGKPAAAV